MGVPEYVIVDPRDLLLLDEPTNHISPSLAEELEAALATYPGTLVIATHDRRLRERFAGGERLELKRWARHLRVGDR